MILEAAALGVGLGIVTGMPLGVVNVAIASASLAGRVRFATGVGLGGALADTGHAALAFIGVGALLTARPALMRWFAIGACVLIVAYVVLAWRKHAQPRISVDASSLARGVVIGIGLTLPNPGALAAWVATTWRHAGSVTASNAISVSSRSSRMAVGTRGTAPVLAAGKVRE